MKAHFHVRETIVFLLLLIATQSKAQHPAEKHNYQRWAYLAGVQGNNFGLPFHDLPSHFTHPGIFVGAERAYKPRSTVFQRFSLGGYLNKQLGDGLSINTQIGLRPQFTRSFYGELKAGIGYLFTFHPTAAYMYEEGEWKTIRGGQSQVIFPLNIGLGYSVTTKKMELAPFFDYQISPTLFYNSTLPLTIYNNFQIGVRTRIFKK